MARQIRETNLNAFRVLSLGKRFRKGSTGLNLETAVDSPQRTQRPQSQGMELIGRLTQRVKDLSLRVSQGNNTAPTSSPQRALHCNPSKSLILARIFGRASPSRRAAKGCTASFGSAGRFALPFGCGSAVSAVQLLFLGSIHENKFIRQQQHLRELLPRS